MTKHAERVVHVIVRSLLRFINKETKRKKRRGVTQMRLSSKVLKSSNKVKTLEKTLA